MSHAIESLATTIIQGWKAHLAAGETKEYEFGLPIEKICGVQICSHIAIRKWKGNIESVVFRVQSFDMGVMDSGNGPTVIYGNKLNSASTKSLTMEQMVSYVERVLEIIPTLRLNKRQGNLSEYVYSDEVIGLFKFDNTTTHSYEECCVCQELTGTKTECEHHLCLLCMSSLHEVEDEDGDEVKKCPMCRETIHLIN
jgi:hypothetical protein